MSIEFRSDVTAELVDWMGDEKSIVRTARVSTLGAESLPAEDAGLIRFLYREGHGTPFESIVATMRFEVPVFVSRQIVKHRISSINEESGRYKELEPVFYVPDADRKVVQVGKTGAYEFEHNRALNNLAAIEIMDVSTSAWESYEYMLKKGIAKEVARMVLPVNIFTTMYVTMNLRSWLNFVSLRTSASGSKPQHEIEMLGNQVVDILGERVPTVMQAWVDNGAKAV